MFLLCYLTTALYFDLITNLYTEALADKIALRHNGRDGSNFYETESGHLVVNLVLGEESTFTCIIKDSLPSTEIVWTIGDEVFQRDPGSLVLNSEVCVFRIQCIFPVISFFLFVI